MIRVVAAIVEVQERLLICQRRRDDVFSLHWEFPGGKIQSGETPEAALVRELREELGVEASIGKEIHRVRHRYAEMTDEVEITFFTASITTDSAATPRAAVTAQSGNRTMCALPKLRNVVFERISWTRRKDLTRYNFLPADRELVERLARGDFSEGSRLIAPISGG